MDKYKDFDNSFSALKLIEKKLEEISKKENVSLSEVMELREKAASHYKICNDILKELASNNKWDWMNLFFN